MTKYQKPQKVWAIIQKKDGIGRDAELYIKNEIVMVGLDRRVLKMNYRSKYEKIVELKYKLK